MSEKLVGVLASVLKVDPTTLTTDEGIAAAEERAKSLKVMTNEEYTGALNTYRESLKDTFYRENKINIHAAMEKQLIEKYGLDAEEMKGKKTEEYIDRIIELKSKANPTGADTKELEKLTNLLKQQKEDYEKRIGETTQQYESRIMDMKLSSELASISPMLDVDADKLTAQLDFIKYQFNRQYKVEIREGKEYVVDTNGEIVRNSDHLPVTVKDVMTSIAEQLAPIKKKAPAGRKPAPGDNGHGSAIDWTAYNSFADFQATERGKHLITGSQEWAKLYGEWKKAKGQ